MDKTPALHDSSSDQSPSDREKNVESPSPDGVAQLNREVPDPDEHLSEEERKKIDKKLLWKLDRTLIPWLCLLYLISFLDRTNIGNAKIEGLQEDLKLSNNQVSQSIPRKVQK